MSGIVCDFSLPTMSLKAPNKKKSIRDKSGECAGHSNGPRPLIHLSCQAIHEHNVHSVLEPILLKINVFLLLYLKKIGLKHVEVPFASDRCIEKEWANNSIVKHHSPDGYFENVNFSKIACGFSWLQYVQL